MNPTHTKRLYRVLMETSHEGQTFNFAIRIRSDSSVNANHLASREFKDSTVIKTTLLPRFSV